MADLDQFASDLIKQKFAGRTIEAAVREELQKDILDRLEDTINAALLNNLPKEKQTEFDRVLDTDQDQIQAFLQKHIPNMNQLIADTLTRFKKTYLG